MHFCNLDDALCCSHNMDDAFWSFGNLDVALCICAVEVIQKIISGVEVKTMMICALVYMVMQCIGIVT